MFFISGFSLIYINVKKLLRQHNFLLTIGSKRVNLCMNEWSPNLTINYLKQEGGSHDVDITLTGWLLNGDAWLQRGGEGGHESGKKWLYNLNCVINYVIHKRLSN